ncbi:DUF4188 domain-containing protein [Streptomyces sp. NPDC004539]|uniref:monooxygenase family protein n=1 Tax=Streptomyces sp. NPDC004539 TaxID=3154280 RepID=UPI0033B8EF17
MREPPRRSSVRGSQATRAAPVSRPTTTPVQGAPVGVLADEGGEGQHWSDKERLLAYAHQRNTEHRPAFNRWARAGKGHVGIWHETFIVPAGSYESVYVDMPAYGLAAATGVIPVGRRDDTAAQRLSSAEK